MYPFLKPGDILILTTVEPGIVERGDIVCIERGHTYVTHRVVDVHHEPSVSVFIAKGDNLLHADRPFLTESRHLLKVFMIVRKTGRLFRPRFGRPIAFLSRKNLTPGIILGRIGRIARGMCGRLPARLHRKCSRQ